MQKPELDRLQRLDQTVIMKVGINCRCGDIPVTQGILGQDQVVGSLIEITGKGVSQ